MTVLITIIILFMTCVIFILYRYWLIEEKWRRRHGKETLIGLDIEKSSQQNLHTLKKPRHWLVLVLSNGHSDT